MNKVLFFAAGFTIQRLLCRDQGTRKSWRNNLVKRLDCKFLVTDRVLRFLHINQLISHNPIFFFFFFSRKKNTLEFSPGHTFGTLSLPDEYGRVYFFKKTTKKQKQNTPLCVSRRFLSFNTRTQLSQPTLVTVAGVGGVVHSVLPGHFMRDRETHRSLVNAVRHSLKKLNFRSFPTLLEAFRHYDKVKLAKVSFTGLILTCCCVFSVSSCVVQHSGPLFLFIWTGQCILRDQQNIVNMPDF